MRRIEGASPQRCTLETRGLPHTVRRSQMSKRRLVKLLLSCAVVVAALAVVTPASAADAAVSINSGGSATGSFTADQYFSGGSTYTTTNTIDTSQITSNVPPAAVLQTARYGAMTYTTPNRTAGSAQTETPDFAETYVTAAGQRIFSVAINGTSVLSSFDIYSAAGGQNRAIARTFSATANSSGQVMIQFTAQTENPKVNGITVVGVGRSEEHTS